MKYYAIRRFPCNMKYSPIRFFPAATHEILCYTPFSMQHEILAYTIFFQVTHEILTYTIFFPSDTRNTHLYDLFQVTHEILVSSIRRFPSNIRNTRLYEKKCKQHTKYYPILHTKWLYAVFHATHEILEILAYTNKFFSLFPAARKPHEIFGCTLFSQATH